VLILSDISEHSALVWNDLQMQMKEIEIERLTLKAELISKGFLGKVIKESITKRK
jgi:hypothetical protein